MPMKTSWFYLPGVGSRADVTTGMAGSDAEAQTSWADSAAFAGAAWLAPFGFSKGRAHPQGSEAPDILLAGRSGDRADCESWRRATRTTHGRDGLALVGRLDTVTRQLERLLQRLPARWLFAWTYNGLIPHAKLMRSIELFYTRVLPRVDDTTRP